MLGLNDPNKAPVVFVYNDTGLLLTNVMAGKSMGIVDFTYTYDDEEEDSCLIRIQASSAEEIDSLGIGRNSILRVQWGYSSGVMSPMATVAVRDINSKYGANIIYTEYHCLDLTTYLKSVRSADIRKISLIDYISDYAANSVNVVIKCGKDIIFKKSRNVSEKEIQEDFYQLGVRNVSFKDPPIFDPMAEFVDGVVKETNAGKWFNTAAWADVQRFLEKEQDMVSINRSPHTIINEYLRGCPYGPWFITGRGDTLFIHNRNLGSSVYRVYNYNQEPGDLIDFTAETKYDTFEKQVISSTTLDPYTKGSTQFENFLDMMENTKTLPEIFDSKLMTSEQRDKELKKFVAAYRAFRTTGGIRAIRYDRFTRQAEWASNYTEHGIPYNESRDIITSKADFESTFVPEGGINNSPLKQYAGTFIFYAVPIDDPEFLMNEEMNTLRGLQMESEEASFILEGDPYLKSEMVVGVDRVQKAHKANYYIKKCEHSIMAMGYKTTLETSRVKPEAVIKSLSAEYDSTIKDKDIKGLYEKQERIFNKWDVNFQLELVRVTGDNSFPYATSKKVVTLQQILEDSSVSGNDDMVVEKIKEYEKAGYNLTVLDKSSTDPNNR
jgi:hypothetical protein